MASKSLASSAALMASGTLVSRILGLVRAAMLAAAIATVGGAANAFSVANKLPTIIYMLIAGGVLNAVLVPQIVRAMRAPDGGHRYVNQLLTLGATALAGVTALLTAGAGLLLTLYAARMSPEWKPLALTFAYICLPQLFFYGLYTLLGQVLNARGNFGPYMWAPALNNVVSILGLGVYLFLYGEYQVASVGPADWDATRIWLVAGTATAGIAAQALVLLIPLHRSGFRLAPIFRLRGSGLGRASKVAGWAFAALAVGQLGYLVISNLAVAADRAGSDLGITVAANAAYDHAFTIFMLPQSLITVSLVTAMFTRLSHHAAAGDARLVRDQLSMGMRTLAVFTVFATAALMVLAIPLVALVLAGSPDWEAQRAIGHVVVAFAAGLVPIGAWTMIQRVYFAYEDTRSLFRIQIPMMVIVVASCAVAYLLFPPQWWVVVGAALGTTASNTFGAGVAYLALRRKLPSLDGGRVLRTHVRVVLAVVPPALAGWGLLHWWGVQAGLLGSLARVALVGTIMAVGYLVMLKILGVAELDGLLERVGHTLRPVTARLAPVLGRVPGAGAMRKMGSFFAPAETESGVVDTSWQPSDVIAERYRLRSRVSAREGEDYSLIAWEGQDEILAKSVRILTLSGPPERVAAALDAARRRAVLSDPCFPRIYRVLQEGDDGVIITEVIDAPLLSDLITAGRVGAAEARSIIGQAAVGLERARRQGVQHLALTPESIAVEADGVRILGLSFEAALAGIEVPSSNLGARRDTIALAHCLIAGLSGKWMGSRPTTLPAAPQSVASAQELHELAPDAPLDLVRLCHLTIGPFEEGPHTPGELAENLRPWELVRLRNIATYVTEDFVTGEFTAVTLDDGPLPPAGVAASPAAAAAPPATAPPATAQEAHSTAALQAPAAELAGRAGTATDGTEAERTGAEHTEAEHTEAERTDGWDVPPGTPPPKVHRVPARAVAPAADGDSTFDAAPARIFPRVEPRPPAPAPTPPAVPAARLGNSPGDKLRRLVEAVADQFRPIGEDEERRFNPSGFVLLAMLALVVFALVLATSSLRSARDFDSSTIPPPNQLESPTDEPAGDPAPEEPAPEATEELEEVTPIVISEAITFDPSTGGGENQDLAHLAIDGDRGTIWRSLRYNSPTYAIKEGLGFAVVLETEAEVSQVILHVDGEGGKVEVRAGDPRNPTAGPALASGAMSRETVLRLGEPVTTDTIVLWFPELPVADSDGMNRIELAEVEVK